MSLTALACMTAALFFEARDQPVLGQEMVAQTVLNRVESPHFPDDVCGVVYQDRQFSFTHDGRSDNPRDYPTHSDRKALLRLEAVAQKALQGELDFTMTSTHYHATSVSPVWNQAWPLDGLVGDHLFYTCDGYC